jgi:hypothetical protein
MSNPMYNESLGGVYFIYSLRQAVLITKTKASRLQRDTTIPIALPSTGLSLLLLHIPLQIFQVYVIKVWAKAGAYSGHCWAVRWSDIFLSCRTLDSLNVPSGTCWSLSILKSLYSVSTNENTFTIPQRHECFRPCPSSYRSPSHTKTTQYLSPIHHAAAFFGFFVPYLLRLVALFPTPPKSIAPLTK